MKAWALTLLVLVLAGCGPGEREAAAVQAAEEFTVAVQAGQHEIACQLLAPPALRELDEPCAEALAQIPPLGAVRGVDVYGHQAEVRGTDDTLFLTDTAGTWQIVAAGCRAQRAQPYDCAIQGR
jgi:hypothetical protein